MVFGNKRMSVVLICDTGYSIFDYGAPVADFWLPASGTGHLIESPGMIPQTISMSCEP
jgi:hypothetical protein